MTIDKKTIEMLNSARADDRKEAIKRLAQSKDEAALKYLATVYRTDSDPEVRDLALKAGKYVRKSLGEVTADAASATMAATPARQSSPKLKTTAELKVSATDITRAQSYINQATDMHTRGDNAKAAQFLERAFALNPNLSEDKFALGLLATVTGLPADQALSRMSSALERGIRRAQQTAAAERLNSQSHRTLALIHLLGAILMLTGYLFMPWVDLGALPIINERGAETTLSAELANQRAQFDEQLRNQGVDISQLPPDVRAIFDEILRVFDALNFQFSGLDVSLVTLGVRNIFDVMGLSAFMEAMAESFGGQFDASAANSGMLGELNPLDYTLILVLVGGVLSVVVAVLLISNRSASLGRWGLCMLFSGLTIVPFVWFYLDSANAFVAEREAISGFGTPLEGVSGTALIGLGYWTSVIGLAVILIMPIIAYLLPQPSAES